MPAEAEVTSMPRVVVDDSSFDFRSLPEALVTEHLDRLNETLQLLLRQRDSVAVAPMWDAVEVLEGCELHQLLTGERPSAVDRDTRSLSLRLLSRLPEWDSDAVTVDDEVVIDSTGPLFAMSVSFALALALQRRGVACLVFPGSARDGYLTVGSRRGSSSIFFFRDASQLSIFWRGVIGIEKVPEKEFFKLAGTAFPELVLHPGLSFRRFDGAYLDLRDKVVAVLAALNDHFRYEYQACQGRPYDVQAAMGSRGADVSPESPNTRKSEKLMRQRDIEFDGHVFRCEWHAKLARNIDRIHFSEPHDKLGGKILIGVFVSHLDT